MSRFRALSSDRNSRRSSLPQLEALEGRIVPATRFVVPAGLADGATNFATVSDALTTPGLAAGDTIQIEPGSSPGDVAATSPPVANLTIQGDPLVGLAAIPEFTFSGAFVVDAASASFGLRNVNVALVGTASFDTDPAANVSISGSNITDSSSSPNGITLEGSANTITGSTLVANNAGITNLVLFQPPDGAKNGITGNSFLAISGVGAGGGLVSYQLLAGNVGVTDQISGNTFQGAGSAFVGVHVLLPSTATSVLSGLAVQSNSFFDSSSKVDAGVFFEGPVGNAIVQSNVVRIMDGDGVLVYGAATGTTTVSALINGNIISTSDNGFGIFIAPGTTAGNAVNMTIQGNDLQGATVGVGVGSITVPGRAGPLSGIDLGGGSQGSLGGNNFRSFTTTATAVSGAIVLDTTNASGTGTITAQKNLFAAGVTPGNEVFPNNSAQIDVGNPLTGNAAYASALYSQTLLRAGDTSNPADAGGAASALDSGAPRLSVANGVVRSTEALGLLVDRLYVLLLGRQSDAAGRANFVTALQKGATVEQVITGFVTSQEYVTSQGSDGAWVQSLYTKLLGRVGSAQEVSNFLAALASQGRAAVVKGFVNSTEFRTLAVGQMYGSPAAAPQTVASLFTDYLHRTSAPPAAEVNGWVNSNLDLLSISVRFAASDEFFANG